MSSESLAYCFKICCITFDFFKIKAQPTFLSCRMNMRFSKEKTIIEGMYQASLISRDDQQTTTS